MPVIIGRIDERARLAPGPASVGRSDDHGAAARWGIDIGRQPEPMILGNRACREPQGRRWRRMPVAGAEADQQIAVPETERVIGDSLYHICCEKCKWQIQFNLPGSWLGLSAKNTLTLFWRFVSSTGKHSDR